MMRPRHAAAASATPLSHPQTALASQRKPGTMLESGIGAPLRPAVGDEDLTPSRSSLERLKWRSVVCAVAAHSCIGGIYTFSLFVEPLSRNKGVVGVSTADWNVSTIIPVFSLTVTMAGLTAAFTGAWAEQVGPRKPIMYAGLFWGGGLMMCAMALYMHSLWLVYLSYGFFGGFGIGLAYAPPVAGLIKWFPDRKGFASGLAIMGFGGGTLLASPLIRSLLDRFLVLPPVVVCDGDSAVRPGAKDLAALGYSSNMPLDDDTCYGSGLGSTGASETIFILGMFYLIALVLTGYFFVPAPASLMTGATKTSAAPSNRKLLVFLQEAMRIISRKSRRTSLQNLRPFWRYKLSSKALVKVKRTVHGLTLFLVAFLPSADAYVPASKAILTPQFARVWIALFTNTTAGIALLGVAKTIISDVYAHSPTLQLDSSAGPMFVAILSFSNAIGRIGFARFSDTVGRKATFNFFFVCGIFTYAFLPALFWANNSIAAYRVFIIVTAFVITIYGGGFAISPAYLADLFGTKEVGAIYARLLTAWAAAGLVGPTLLAWLRRTGEMEAIRTLVGLMVDEGKSALLVERFGGGSFKTVEEFISRHGVSLDALVALSGVDPRNHLYDRLSLLCILLAAGLVANFTMRPVESHFFVEEVPADIELTGGGEERAPISHIDGTNAIEDDHNY